MLYIYIYVDTRSAVPFRNAVQTDAAEAFGSMCRGRPRRRSRSFGEVAAADRQSVDGSSYYYYYYYYYIIVIIIVIIIIIRGAI